jgi:segregation and condensation protein B
MQYGTTRKFLEIFGLRDLRELPTLEEIDQLLPEGIGEEEASGEKETLSQMHETAMEFKPDQDREVEWNKITEDIQKISTTTDFFEQEKERQRRERDETKAETIRFAIQMGDPVENKDKKWLARYEAKLQAELNPPSPVTSVAIGGEAEATSQASEQNLSSIDAVEDAELEAIHTVDLATAEVGEPIEELETEIEAEANAEVEAAAEAKPAAEAEIEAEIEMTDETLPIDGELSAETLTTRETAEEASGEAEASGKKLSMVEYQSQRLAQILKDFENEDEE